MSFNRTLSGQIAKHEFIDKPFIWVEGRDDVFFYTVLLSKHDCHIEDAGGREECMKLAQAVQQDDHPFMVVLDGDYEILRRQRSFHRRVILLQRYAIENYMFEAAVIERIVRNLLRIVDPADITKDTFETLEANIQAHLTELIVVDAAHQLNDSSEAVCPRSRQQLLKNTTSLDIDSGVVRSLHSNGKKHLPTSKIEKTRKLVDNYTKERRAVDLLRGHIVFDLVRRLVFVVTESRTGRNPRISNEHLLSVLIYETCNTTNLSSDHESLRKRLYRAIREIRSRKFGRTKYATP